MFEYEVRLKYTGKSIGRKIPNYVHTEYGFGSNPPIVVRAKNKTNAIKQLNLPKSGLVIIKSIRRV